MSGTLNEKIKALIIKIESNNIWRQQECINLIPSETTPSALVKLCEISDPAGRYAEHRTLKGKEVYFYQGVDLISEVEEELRGEMSRYFGCPNIELRPVSGQMANEIVFKALVKFVNRDRKSGQPSRRLRLVLNNDLNKGGHLSSQPMGALFNYVEEDRATGKENVVNFPVMKDNHYRTDTALLEKIVIDQKPELIIFGKSLFLHREPVDFVAGLVGKLDPRPVLMYDMAHVLGLYGAFQDPFKEGADIVTGSTHKTFFGPQRGVVASTTGAEGPLARLWPEIKSRAFPGSTSNHHLGTLLGLLVATYEMNAYKDDYQAQTIKNAKAFARALHDNGLEVQGDPGLGFTETHQAVIRVKKFGPGNELARRLEENNIVANFQALPDDATFLEASGIRMGVQEMTRFGMKEDDFGRVAGLIAEVLTGNRQVKDEVKRFRSRFLSMQYCLPPAETAGLAARLLTSIFPDQLLIKQLTDLLKPRPRAEFSSYH